MGKYIGDMITSIPTAESALVEKCKENYKDLCGEECQQPIM